MSIKLSLPQRSLLDEAAKSKSTGVLKSIAYGPAVALVGMGYARWAIKHSNGLTGMLVITEKGRNFRSGSL